MKKVGLPESEVLKQCMEYLQVMGIYCWRNNTGACKSGNRYIRFGYKGSSDILGLTKDGRFLAVECKKEYGGVVSKEQKEFMWNITHNHGVSIVANSVESLKQQLKENCVI